MPRWRQSTIVLAGALLMLAAMASDTGAPRAQGGDSAEEVFEDHISEPIVQSRCINCHVAGGVSGHTRLVLAPSTAANHEALNLETFKSLLDAVADDGGASYVLNKIQGVAHGGGVQVPAGSSDFANMEWFLQLLAGGGDTATASLDAGHPVRHGAPGAALEDAAAGGTDLRGPPADGRGVRRGGGR